MRIKIRGTGIVLVSAALAGCGGSTSGGQRSPTSLEDRQLRGVGELYRMHQIVAKKAPRSLRDFDKVDASALGYYAIRSGKVVVRWQATLPDTETEPSSPPSDEVLAYSKAVPQQGGPVLMLDRRIRHMTPEEFKAARLAGVAEEKKGKSR
jgi:hypothetical protein